MAGSETELDEGSAFTPTGRGGLRVVTLRGRDRKDSISAMRSTPMRDEEAGPGCDEVEASEEEGMYAG